jgi:ectoine hydroxylase-related dioxygenase (phytanoyl-CoA dioxygenase family)
LDDIVTAFVDDGFCILSQALPENILGEWEAFAHEHFRHCFELLHKKGHIQAPTHHDGTSYVLGLGIKHGFKEIVMRSPGRYELSLLNYPKEENYEIPDIHRIVQPLEQLLPRLLMDQKNSMDQLKLCHLSLLVAAPGSTEQCWHCDGGHVSLSKQLACHCVNVFIPLQDTPLTMGPTEFRPASHFLTRNLGPMMLAAKCRKTLRNPVWAPWRVGDVVIFDYRLLHRGKANTTNASHNSNFRNVLVLTFCEAWFHDIVNFPRRSMMEQAAERSQTEA